MKALVVGGGSIGRRHLHNLRILGIRPIAVAEPDPERRTALCEDGIVVGFEILEQGLEWKPDFVVIATPNHLHVKQALQAGRMGCHLFIEKPLSHTVDGLGELLEEISSRSLISLVGCNMRFHPGPASVKRLIDEGMIGKIIAARIQTGSYLPRWRPWQDFRQSYSASSEWGGAILDCIHELDLALWYFGPATVIGAAHLPATAIGLETDGLAEVLLSHATGVLSNVHLNFVQRDYRRTCQIIGREGTIYWDFGERRVDVYGADGERVRSFPEPDGWDINQMYVDELSHFIKCVEAAVPTINPVSDGLVTLQIALAARQPQARIEA